MSIWNLPSVPQIEEGDEESFILFEEQVIYQIQALWRQKEGIEMKPVLELSTKLEDLIYQQTLKNFSLSNTASVWAKKECIQYYQEMTSKMINNLANKSLNWKKIFEDHEKTPQNILKQILKDDEGKKKSASANKTPKEPKIPKESKEPKESKGPKGPPRAKDPTKSTKKKAKETATTLSAAPDDIDMFAAPSDSMAFDDSLFPSGDVDLFDDEALAMDDLFKFSSDPVDLNLDEKAWMS